MSVVVIGSGMKQWACAVEYMLEADNKSHIVLDFRNLQTVTRKSFRMKKVEKKLINAKFVRFKMRYFLKYECILQSVFLWRDVIKNDSLEYKLRYYDVDIIPILRNTFSELQKTSNVKINKIGKRKILWEIFRIILIIEFLARKNIISENLVLYNGRDLVNASILSFALSKKQNYTILERGSSNKKYAVFRSTPQDNTEWWKNIRNFQCTSLMEKSRDSYLRDKSNGYDPVQRKDWRKHFNSKVDLNRITFNSKKCIVFFSSSTFEHSVTNSPDKEIGFKNQFSAVSALIDEVQSLGMTLVIRRHPNSMTTKGIDNEHTDWVKLLNSEIIYFGPNSGVNSYELASKASCSFVFKSSIGFDLLCKGLPAFALGPAKWSFDKKFQCFDRNYLHEILIKVEQGKIMDYIADDRVQIINRYACFYSNHGIEYKNFVFVERWGCKMTQGPIIYKSLLYRPFYYLLNPKNLLTKLLS